MTTFEPVSSGGGPSPDPEWTLFAVDSLASPSPPLVSGSGGMTRVGVGRGSLGYFADYDPLTRSWRTCRVSLDGEWERYSETWPSSGMTRSGIAYRLPPSVPRTSASGGSRSLTDQPTRWPTPLARDYRTGHRGRLDQPGRHGGWNLNDWVAMWPTPKASDGERGGRGDLLARVRTGRDSRRKNWSTPTAADGLGGPGRSGGEGEDLRTAVGGQLNPLWVEALMGFPLGWTDLDGVGKTA